MSDIIEILTKDFLVHFLYDMIETSGRIQGDYNGKAGLTYQNDSYDKIVEEYLINKGIIK
jgi:hypothetical protein